MPTIRLNGIPADIVAAIETQTGPVLKAEPVPSGLNSEIAVRLHTTERSVFVKGLRADHPRVWTQEREAQIAPYVVGIAPRLLWRIHPGEWDLLGFEDIGGRHADYAPGSADLPLVAEAMRHLGEIPCPDLPLKKMSDRMKSYVDDTVTLALFDGDRLLHTDWNHANVLITDRARIVDWAWASRGAGWIDPALWAIWLISRGHTPTEAEQWAAHLPAWGSASPEAVDAFAAASARLWDEIAGDEPDAWTQRIQSAAASWSDHRRGPRNTK
ncbi:aminoglycoside phosphotransferase [Streptomyces inhibens]|uniref:aminoglycoside phosphotransferase n=1 Tax=Streptomyces inhibens TaxID=2293571 RepID=UPI003686D656